MKTTIKQVHTKQDFKVFLDFQKEIYKGDKLWVPMLSEDLEFTLDKSPFWEHSQKILFLAYDENKKVVGRVAAIIDNNFVSFQEQKTGFFGFFECINDQSVAKTLLEHSKEWLKKNGMTKMIGPTNPSTNDECGFLFEGYGSMPRIMMPYNPSYYHTLMENCGLSKAKDLFAFEMNINNAPVERLERVVEIANKKTPGITVKKLNPKNFKAEIDKAIEIYNSAWEKNWGFVPWTTKEFQTIAGRMKPLFLPDTTLIAEINNKPVGMLIAVPDYNFVLNKMNGKMFPFGFIKFLYYKNKLKDLRLMIMGIKKEFRQKGIEAIMYLEALKNARLLGFQKCEFSWVLEDNVMTTRAAEMMGGKLYKKYRVYETTI